MSGGGARPRNRALCCQCGEVRTVAHNFRGSRPSAAKECEPFGPWCSWLLCSHCGLITVHAVIVEVLAARWRVEGCDREQSDRHADRSRRRIERRLGALAADGVTVVRVRTSDVMTVHDAIVEVVEYADARGLVVRICTTDEPSRVLRALEMAEDALDAPTHLGPWADAGDGIRRGLAVMRDAL